METNDKKSVSNAMSERATWIKVGLLIFRLRPITLSQIYEMGAVANDLDIGDLDKDKHVSVMAETISHYKDAKIMSKIFIICLFRSMLMRVLFGWYIRHSLTLGEFEKLIMYESTSFNVNFFLTSIVFLKRTVQMTDPNPTIAHGQ